MATIGTGWVDGAWVQAGWITGAWSDAATASIAGTAITGGVLESEIVAGGETIVITLTADTWVADGATFNAQRQNIIDGLDSDGVEATGWNAEIRDKEVVGSVVRTSDTVATITLTASPDYAVDADETITVTVPAAALAGGSPLTATPTFDITAEAVAAEEENKGSWLSPEQVRNLRKLAEKAKRTRQKDFRREKDRQFERIAELRAIFDRVQGTPIISPEMDEVARTVAPFTESKKAAQTVPQAKEVDFKALLGNARATAELATALAQLSQTRTSEDETMVLLMMAA